MGLSSSVQAVILGTVALLCGVLAYVVGIRRRTTSGSLVFALLLVAAGEWGFMTALERLVIGQAAKISCAKIEYLGIMSIAPLWLMFALHYTGQDRWLTRRKLLLLWVIPVITVILAMTNEWHHLIWPNIYPSSDAPGATLTYEHGVAFWLAAIFNYTLLLAGSITLIQAIYRFPQIYHRQAAALLTGMAFPWIGNVLYLTNINPLGPFDLTPLAFSATGIVYVWTIFRGRLFDLMPIARYLLVEQMADGMIVLDARNQIADMNPSAYKMIGAGADLIGQNIDSALAEWPSLLKHLKDNQDGQTTLSLESPILRYIEVRVSKLHDQRQQFGGRLVVLRDVSERERLERERENLARTMVHDLRNPLTVILGVAEAVRETIPLTGELPGLIDIADESLQRMLTLVNTILSVSELESGAVPVEKQETRLETLTADAIRGQSPLIKRKGITLINAVPDGLPTISVDVPLMARVFQNLIDNAIKFTPSGGTIRIDARHESEARQIAVSVSDTGPGISPELRDRLFEKFSSGNIAGRGSGLGLAFCRLVVEAHGGSIHADNRVEGGTSFTFRLPLERAD